MAKYYLTTTAPYVNAKPHIGFALEIVQADALARFRRLAGDDVFFSTGTDEHGQKIYQKAVEEGKDPKAYADEYAQKFTVLKDALNLSYDVQTRTTNPHHVKAAQEIWKLCAANGYIEKGIYKAKYCVGCELEKQDSELENGKCPIHPNMEIETIEEENYFFKFSKLQDKLLALYAKYPDFVLPAHRQTEIVNFVQEGLNDFSISRLADKMPWGVPVPGDDKHIMYVWFDALTFYISELGWPEDTQNFTDFWGTVDKPNAIQVAGKDNLRQQTAMWQAMLLAAGLPTSRQIFIHGFITSGGQKMSKSLGNVIDPLEYVEKYGTDALRYYLLAKVSPAEDSDFTKESFEQVYQSDLANGLGNLVARVAGLCQQHKYSHSQTSKRSAFDVIKSNLNDYQFNTALFNIWGQIRFLDELISQERPWEIKSEVDLKERLWVYVGNLQDIAYNLQPFMPETAGKINEIFSGSTVIAPKPLFPRLDS